MAYEFLNNSHNNKLSIISSKRSVHYGEIHFLYKYLLGRGKTMRQITVDEQRIMLEKHGRWLDWLDGGEQLDLRDAYFMDGNLSGANLQKANLEGVSGIVDLSRTDLTYAKLMSSSFPFTNFSNANLTQADLAGTNLSHSNLNGAILVGANLKKANLTNAKLTGSDLSDANLAFAKLENTNFSGANLSRAYFDCTFFINTNLQGANLEGTTLINANLEYTDLSKANLKGARIDGAKFKDGIIPSMS
jgi:uncharacterized protein YjbI with pentapeptide repeats